jgi:lysozyme family protein
LSLQQQLKQLGLHVEQTGVMDKSTEGYIMAIQTGGGSAQTELLGPRRSISCSSSIRHRSNPTQDNEADRAKTQRRSHARRSQARGGLSIQSAANQKCHRSLNPSQQRDMEQFIKNWDKNKARYEEVAATAGIPAKLVASLHWRESTGDFGTYLHQGDPLGKKAVHEPSFDQGVPIFKEWEPAAEHALEMKKGIKKAYKIDQETTDEAALASYAERYNGLGYHNYHSMASPYVFAGTDQYAKGKYRSDGAGGWDDNYKDTQLGVIPMMRNIDQHEKELAAKAAAAKKQAEGAAPAAEQHDDKAAPPNLHFAQ